MSLKSILGLESSPKVRYAIVALGDISQESLMPGVAHTGNSVISALVTSDPVKAKKVAGQYDIPPENVYDYAHFDDLLASGKIDAVYIATPNWRHAEFAVPAINAGVHVLLEKPMEVSIAKCQEILDAQSARPQVKLMIAYRLHFEPATLAVLELLRAGKLGKLRGFGSIFTQLVDPQNHRATSGDLAGPLFDMGPYPINAARNFFEAEPISVSAVAVRHPDAGLPMDFDHTVAVTLVFPQERVAQFTVSYVAPSVDTLTLYGTEGSLRFTPAYGMGKPKAYELTKDDASTTKTFPATDHFGGEVKAFSDHILQNTAPEPDGQEGLRDLRVIDAALESLKVGRSVPLPPADHPRRIEAAHAQKLPPVKAKTLVNTAKPSVK